jgi:cytochrome c2
MFSRRWTLILFVLAAVFSLGLAACGDDEPEASNTIDDAGDTAGDAVDDAADAVDDAADEVGGAIGDAADDAGDALGIVAGDPEAGAMVYTEQGCEGCHAVEGDGAGMSGPSLANLGNEAGDRTDQNAAEYVRESITNPSAHIVEGYQDIMPPYDLPGDQLDNLVAYLLTLTGD